MREWGLFSFGICRPHRSKPGTLERYEKVTQSPCRPCRPCRYRSYSGPFLVIHGNPRGHVMDPIEALADLIEECKAALADPTGGLDD